MSKEIVHIGTSLDAVVRKTATEIACRFLLANKDWFTEALHSITGQPVDWDSEPLPIEATIFMEGFVQGVCVCLTEILSGDIDLYLVKKEIADESQQPRGRERRPK